MSRPPDEHFEYTPHPEFPGWHSWRLRDPERFNAVVMGELITRREGDKCRLRMFPEKRHTNVQGVIHGAVSLALIDIAMSAGLYTLTESQPGPAVTLELSTQFIGAGRVDEPLDAVVEVLRETRRLLFMRGEVVQAEHLVAGFTGLLRKASNQ